MSEQCPQINEPEYIEEGFGWWWHLAGQSVEQEVEVENDIGEL